MDERRQRDAVRELVAENIGLRDDNNPNADYFWYQPIANISPDGKWVLFTSNWEKTLGSDPTTGYHRDDVFLVKLVPGS